MNRLALLLLALPCLAAASPSAIRVRVTGSDGQAPQAGAPLRISVTASDPATGAALTSMTPALWLVPEDGTVNGRCEQLAKSVMFPNGTVDVTGFDVIQATEDGRLALIDPLLNLASANIKSMLNLGGPPSAWTLTPSGQRLIVARDGQRELLLVDLERFKVTSRVPTLGTVQSLASTGRQIVAGTDSGAVVLIAEDGTTAPPIRLGEGPVTVVSGDRLAVALSRSGHGAFLHHSGSRTNFRVRGATRDVAYVARSDSVYALSEDGRTLSIVAQDDPGRPIALALDRSMRTVVASPSGQWLALIAADGAAVTIFDVVSSRSRWTIASNDPITQATFSDQFLYLAHLRQGGTTRVVFDPQGGPPGTVTIAAGSNSDVPNRGGRLPLLAAIPGAGMLIGSARDRAAFMVNDDNAQAAMSSLPLRAGAPSGLMLRYRGLTRKGATGVYEGRATVPHGGQYLAVVRLSQPNLAGCVSLLIATAPGEARRPTVTASSEIMRTLALPDRLPPGRQSLAFSISGPPVELLGALLVGSDWQQVPPDIRSQRGGYVMPVDVPPDRDIMLFVRYRDGGGERVLTRPIRISSP